MPRTGTAGAVIRDARRATKARVMVAKRDLCFAYCSNSGKDLGGEEKQEERMDGNDAEHFE